MPHKVAAVCYKADRDSIEFLLVRTKSGKWTFPKGNIEPHLSLSESAQLEAYEEAGALGTIADVHFDFYLHEKSDLGEDRARALVVAVFLLAVEKTIPPEETHRDPRWFTPEEAKSRLSRRRSQRLSLEFSRVIDNAVSALYTRSFRPGRSFHLPVPHSSRAYSSPIW